MPLLTIPEKQHQDCQTLSGLAAFLLSAFDRHGESLMVLWSAAHVIRRRPTISLSGTTRSLVLHHRDVPLIIARLSAAAVDALAFHLVLSDDLVEWETETASPFRAQLQPCSIQCSHDFTPAAHFTVQTRRSELAVQTD
jgi:hypothetical protein